MTLARHLSILSPGLFFHQRELLHQLVRREIEARYRGSTLGVAWSFVTPMLMLAVFTFVFSVVFEARWGTAVANRADFALMLFPGMVLYGAFAEIMSRAPSLIVSNPSYVKKIVFPLELLSLVAVGSAMFHALVGLAAVVLFRLVLHGSVPLTILWLPVVLLPFVVFLLGVAWLLSSLGVYLRDLAQLTGVLATMLMFMSPVFYPVDALPLAWRPLIHASPLSVPLEETRRILVTGVAPDFASLALYGAIVLVFMLSSLYWFQRTRKGFADVL